MKTIIFDIDGTLTDLWPLERAVLIAMTGRGSTKQIDAAERSNAYKIFRKVSRSKISKGKYRELYDASFFRLSRRGGLPKLERFPTVQWIISNRDNYHFVYATGGLRREALYVLKSFGLSGLFDVANSLDRDNCRYSKRTGIPFKRMKGKFSDCVVVTDTESDCDGARLAGVPCRKIRPRQRLRRLI